MTKEEFKKAFMATAEKWVNPANLGTGIMNRAQVNEWLKTNDFIYDTGRHENYPQEVFFIPSERHLGLSMLGSRWVASTVLIPHSVTPREGLESGRITTFDEYLFIYHKDDTFIESIDELYDYLYPGVNL